MLWLLFAVVVVVLWCELSRFVALSFMILPSFVSSEQRQRAAITLSAATPSKHRLLLLLHSLPVAASSLSLTHTTYYHYSHSFTANRALLSTMHCL